MNKYIRLGIHTKQEKKQFLENRKRWTSMSRQDLEIVVVEQEEAIKFRRWFNRVSDNPSYADIRRYEDNIKFIRAV